jgi:hypothetical protein
MTEKRKVNPLQRAWAAGVFDARIQVPKAGCILRLDTIDETLAKRFLEVTGVGQIKEDRNKATTKPVQVYRTVSMDDTRELILFVAPLLSPLKLKLASEVLGRVERSPWWRKNYPEKAASCVIVPAPNAEDEHEQPNTATAGDTVSPAD